MPEILKGVLALYLTFDSNRDTTGISREGSHDPEWNAIIPESNQYLESWIIYVGVRLDINGHTTDPKESNWRSLT